MGKRINLDNYEPFIVDELNKIQKELEGRGLGLTTKGMVSIVCNMVTDIIYPKKEKSR